VELPASEEKALNVALNSPHIAGEWTDGLGDLLGDLKLELGDGFGELRFDALAKDVPKSLAGVVEDEVPEPPKVAVTRPGDLWILGAHRLLLRDRDRAAVLRRGGRALAGPDGAQGGAERGGSVKLQIVPLDLAEANEIVRRWHRHHKPTLSHKFSIGVVPVGAEEVCGAAIVGRPIARRIDNGWTLEVLRVATDGTANACSSLYGAAWRVAREMGYRRLVTYTLPSESGASLRGAGWKCIGETPGRSWSVPSRPRVDKHPLGQKLIWEATA
jgi:hypothetical protein